MIFDKENYEAFDTELWQAIHAEEVRQQNNIELIASENVVSKTSVKLLLANSDIASPSYPDVIVGLYLSVRYHSFKSAPPNYTHLV